MGRIEFGSIWVSSGQFGSIRVNLGQFGSIRVGWNRVSSSLFESVRVGWNQVNSGQYVFFFLRTRSGIRIGSGLTRTDHNPIGFVNFKPIGFRSRPEPEIYRVGSGRVKCPPLIYITILNLHLNTQSSKIKLTTAYL